MSLAEKIFLGFFLIYGLAQTIANSYHFFSKNGIVTGRKQHGEIPKTATDREIRMKVLFMMITGFLFFLIGVYTLISGIFNYYLFLGMLILNSLYVFAEAIYYRYWSCFSAFAITLVLVILFYIFI